MPKLRPPVKIHGGKFYLSNWIIEHLPKDYTTRTYCELCCGGCSVLLNKERSSDEVINDINKGVVSIFKALRDEPKEYISRLKAFKYKESTFQQALERAKEDFDDYIS